MSLSVPAFESPPAGDDGIAAALAEGRPAMIVERPDVFGSRRAPAPLEVLGWAWSGAGIESVVVAVDDELVVEATHDLFRPDLCRIFGDDLVTSGFAVRIDPRDWTPGPHRLTVVAIDYDERAIGISGEIESVVTPPVPAAPAGTIDPLPAERDGEYERYLPSVHRDGASTPQHEARYRWAARAAERLDVLDAGCGGGRGTAFLAAHARRAVGVDVSPRAIASAEHDHGSVAAFHRGDVLDLPFGDGEFDLVACFETIERVEDVERALDELQRVLRPEGVLLISSANRGAYPSGNPLHVDELTSAELRATLQARFADVAIYRQQTYIASLSCDDPDRPIPTHAIKTAATTPGDEPYTIASATNGPQPAPPRQLALGTPFDPGEQERLVDAWRKRCAEAEARAAQARSDAGFRERALAAGLDRLAATEAELSERVAVAERELEGTHSATAAVLSSASWRLTAPLRSAKRMAVRARRIAGDR